MGSAAQIQTANVGFVALRRQGSWFLYTQRRKGRQDAKFLWFKQLIPFAALRTLRLCVNFKICPSNLEATTPQPRRDVANGTQPKLMPKKTKNLRI